MIFFSHNRKSVSRQPSVFCISIGEIWGYLCCQILLWFLGSHPQSRADSEDQEWAGQKQPCWDFSSIKEKLYLESFHKEEFFQHHFCPIFPTALGGWDLALPASVGEDSHRTRGWGQGCQPHVVSIDYRCTFQLNIGVSRTHWTLGNCRMFPRTLGNCRMSDKFLHHLFSIKKKKLSCWVCEVVSCCGFNLYIFFWEKSVQILCPFSSYVSILLVSCKGSLWILALSLLLNIHFVNIFSRSLGCLSLVLPFLFYFNHLITKWSLT